MANSDKNIVITPNRSSSTDQPKIAFTGQGNSTVTLRVLDDANNTLSFEGNVGQLFSISNSLTGNIFSVNDISGIPSVRVNSDGNVFLAELSGNVGVGNVAPTHKLSVTGTMNVSGNANVGNLGTAGNITASYFFGNGSQLTGITVAAGTSIVNGTSNVVVSNNGNVTTSVGGTSNVLIVTSTGANVTGTFNATGNANVGNIGATAAVLAGPLSGVTTVNASGNANVGNIGATRGVFTNISGTIESGSASQTNITAVGTLTALTVSGNITGQSNVLVTSNITAGNINSVSGILSVTGNANVGNIGATRGVFTNVVGTLETASQTNITSVGTLGSLTVSGNITGQANVLVTSNITAGNINSVSGILSVTGNANVGNIGATRGVFTNISGTIESGSASQTNITSVGTLSSLTVSGNITGQSNVLVTSNITAGNINSVSGILSVTGNANVGNIGSLHSIHTGNGSFGNINSVSGILSVTGNANVGNLGAAAGVFTGTLSVTGNSTQGNITTGNTITYGQFGTPIKLRVLTDNSLSFEGSSGQLFTINDSLTGDIFNVNDITGLPSIRVNSDGNVFLAEYNGNVGIGNVAPAHKLSVTGTMNVSGNANVGNLGAAAGVFSGNITAGNINSVSGILSVTGNANVGNIGATRGVFTNISGTIESGSASQTNITSVGTLSSLTVSGNITGQSNVLVTSNITAGNINSVSGILSVTGNANVGNLGTAGNITASYFFGNGSQLTGITVAAGSSIVNGTSNVVVISNGNVTTSVGGTSNVLVVSAAGAVVTGTFNATGNANVGNIGATRGVFTNIAGTLETASQTNITAVGTLGSLSVTGNANVGNIGATRGVFTNISGTIESGSASQTNITAVGTLGSLTVSGNITGQSNVLVTSNITAGNINSVSGILSVTGNANVGNIGATRGVFTNIVGTLETASQTNITSVGTLGSLSVTGNANVGNIGATRGVFTNIAGTIESGSASQTNITAVGTLGSLTVSGNITGQSNVLVTSNITAGNINSVSGILSVTGNANVGNVGATRGVFTNVVGTLETASQTNITSVGTLGSLSVTGNANVGNIGATRGVFTNIAGTIESGSASQTNITAVGTLTALTVSGNLTVDTNTLFVDATNNRVGIGTTSPAIALDLGGGTNWINTNTTYTNILTSAKIIQIYDSSQSVLNIVSGANTDGGVLGGILFSRSLGQGDAHYNVAGITAVQKSIGVLSGAELLFYTKAGGAPAERMRIDTNGNIGIGTTTPAYPLDVKASSFVGLRITNSAANDNVQIRFRGNQTNAEQWAIGNEVATNGTGRNFDIYDMVSAVNRLRINSSGNVGIGTTTPQRLLHINTTTADTHVYLSSSGPSITLGDNATFASNTMQSVFALATSATQYGQNAGTLLIANYGNSRNNIVIDANYSGTGTKDVVIQPGSGNVGIGTTPSYLLDIKKTTGEAVFRSLAGTVDVRSYASQSFSVGYTGTFSAHDLLIVQNSLERMRFSNAGGIDIGGVNSTNANFTIYSTGLTYVPLRVQHTASSTNDAPIAFQLARLSSGTPAAGMGCTMQFVLQDAGGSQIGTHQIVSAWSNAAALNRETSLRINYSKANSYYEALRIDTNGNIGIATTTPQVKFHLINGTQLTAVPGSGTYGGPVIIGNDNTLYGMYIGSISSGAGYIQQQRGDSAVTYPLSLQPNGGNVGIGLTNPTYQLQLSTDSAGKLSSNIWQITSDSRVKTVKGDYQKGLAEICQVRPVRYEFNGKAGITPDGKEHVSILAQEIMHVFPECVGTFRGKLEEDGPEVDIYNYDGHAITFALINAIKELKAEIDILKARN
jgi:hypothetical protein